MKVASKNVSCARVEMCAVDLDYIAKVMIDTLEASFGDYVKMRSDDGENMCR